MCADSLREVLALRPLVVHHNHNTASLNMQPIGNAPALGQISVLTDET